LHGNENDEMISGLIILRAEISGFPLIWKEYVKIYDHNQN